jgi:hypothetical protein
VTFKIRFIYTLLLALTLAFIWGCASGKKATTEIQSPESAPSSTPAKGDPAESLPLSRSRRISSFPNCLPSRRRRVEKARKPTRPNSWKTA